MRNLPLFFIATILPGAGRAHIGHLGEVAGHGHWIALGGIALAGAIALIGARGKKAGNETAARDDREAEDESEEAPA